MSIPYPTPHIDASPSDFAETVLMPGDPLRSKFIAENFFERPKLINNVRGIQGYTGVYQDTPVTVMASGMGIPSIGIYSYELFNFFGVKNILRTGSAGGMSPKIKVRDVVIGLGACTDSNYAHQFGLPGTFAPTADFTMLETCVDIARGMQLPIHIGNVVSSDAFYGDASDLTPQQTSLAKWSKMGVLAVEMEAAALYMNAARAGKRALAILTISDHLVTGESLDALARQESFTDMITLSLRTAVALAGR